MVTPMLPYLEAVNAGALVMYAHMEALRARHEVTLATFEETGQIEWDAINRSLATGVDIHVVPRSKPSGIARWVRRGRIAVGWLRGGRPLRILESVDPPMQHLIDRLLSEGRFDLVEMHYDMMAGYRYHDRPPATLIEHEVGLISASDDCERATGRMRHLLSEIEWRRCRRYELEIWNDFDRIQVFTPRERAVICGLAPSLSERVWVNPFGIELPAAADPAREEADTIIFNGWFGHPPNVDAALWLGHEIMPLLRARRPGIRLTIVGDRPSEAVRALAGEDITVTGRVPMVEPYLERAAVVLAPLRDGGGMRRKVLQAMALGKAVVTTPIGAEGLAVGNDELPLVVAAGIEGIVNAVEILLDGREARHALGRRARTFVARHHGWSAYEQRLEAMYAGLSRTGATTQ
jgi:glycosyltransferase involved in cell wall biosynthesis